MRTPISSRSRGSGIKFNDTLNKHFGIAETLDRRVGIAHHPHLLRAKLQY
ncbi:hypothetical protein MC7420_2783 [Coleofasciculus chthonoplastes PCC 7420]|uniref:Uncharacterized protein n=1 Tax=Coleofasciculus chthonoplastes PCC 7420 TaxID=118168 RepID=B4W3J4_9CYAN|nr:hypothetical protein MC7420_2783 [Coleofasciculus chthonoplastes PCC 7420]